MAPGAFAGASAVLTLGSGFFGTVRKMKIFSWAKTALEITHVYTPTLVPLKNAYTDNCRPYYNNVGCTHCDKDMISVDTDFKFNCFPYCTSH
jgi:hypothetical protein